MNRTRIFTDWVEATECGLLPGTYEYRRWKRQERRRTRLYPLLAAIALVVILALFTVPS